MGEFVVPEDKKITVCSACSRASCWQGEFYCDDYKTAGTKEMTVSELRKLNIEHESYWNGDALPRSISG